MPRAGGAVRASIYASGQGVTFSARKLILCRAGALGTLTLGSTSSPRPQCVPASLREVGPLIRRRVRRRVGTTRTTRQKPAKRLMVNMVVRQYSTTLPVFRLDGP